jgi:hypothetical protein
MKKNNSKKSKYSAELEKLKELNAIKEVLKKSDIENAALTNTSKDSETVSDTVIDNMLNRLNLDKNANKDLEIVERLGSEDKSTGRMTKAKTAKKQFKTKNSANQKNHQKGKSTKRKKR